MLVRDRKDVGRNLRTAADRGLTVRVRRAGGAGRPGFTRPAIDQDGLTVVLLFVTAVLSALNVMLRFPDLGAVVASFNQF